MAMHPALAWYALMCLLLLGLAAPAAARKADKLFVFQPDTAVRQEPRASAPRVLVLQAGHLLVELESMRGWLQVAIARTGGKIGWVRRRDITRVQPQPAIRMTGPELELFASEVEEFNREVMEETGAPLFTRFEAVTPDLLHLTASAMWQSLPRSAMRRNLARLASRWAQLNDSGNPVWVEVVDSAGVVVMSERRGG